MISFLKWTKWANRDQLNDDIKHHGVYMLAHFKRPPCGAGKLSRKIVYIGETCKQTLKKRMNQFNNSAFRNSKGHSGGRTHREKFKKVRNNLYVSVCPVKNLNDPIRSFYIRYRERKLLYHYVRKFGRPPECNTK